MGLGAPVTWCKMFDEKVPEDGRHTLMRLSALYWPTPTPHALSPDAGAWPRPSLGGYSSCEGRRAIPTPLLLVAMDQSQY